METNPIRWKLNLQSSPTAVYAMLSTDEGRVKFWAESSVQKDGVILFRFPDGLALEGRVIDHDPPYKFVIQYWAGSRVTFDLKDDGMGGTDLSLTDYQETKEARLETFAGWLSVLLPLKAAVDFGVDLRNHDPKRTWDQGYVDN